MKTIQEYVQAKLCGLSSRDDDRPVGVYTGSDAEPIYKQPANIAEAIRHANSLGRENFTDLHTKQYPSYNPGNTYYYDASAMPFNGEDGRSSSMIPITRSGGPAGKEEDIEILTFDEVCKQALNHRDKLPR